MSSGATCANPSDPVANALICTAKTSELSPATKSTNKSSRPAMILNLVHPFVTTIRS